MTENHYDESDAAAHVLTQAQQEHYSRIIDLNTECDRARFEYEKKKREASEARKNLDELSEELSKLISEGPDRQQKLPFDTPSESPGAWQDTPIGRVITVTDKQREKLDAANVKTVGDFENLRAGKLKDYPAGLSSLRGVGEKTIDKWEDEIVEWLAENSREPEQEEDAPADDGGDDDHQYPEDPNMDGE